MKTIVVTAALLALSAAPALAMGCCGGGKGKAAMCARPGTKGDMAMKGDAMKGCCCKGMGGNMSKRG